MQSFGGSAGCCPRFVVSGATCQLARSDAKTFCLAVAGWDFKKTFCHPGVAVGNVLKRNPSAPRMHRMPFDPDFFVIMPTLLLM